MRAKQTIAIVGIDTGVGKSIVTGLLASFLISQKRTTTTLKLVQTGCTGMAEDIQLHRKLMKLPLSEFDTAGVTCPYVFPFPSSPSLAARLQGETIEKKTLDRCRKTLLQEHDWLLMEGAGGLMVPLNDQLSLIDYLEENKVPLILVTSPRLGSINLTLLCLEAIATRKMSLLGLVYNLHGETPKEIVVDTLRECRKGLQRYGFAEQIVMLPDTRESRAVNWEGLIHELF